MLIVPISKKENLEKALKILKAKVINTKQQKILFERKEFTKKSVKRRTIIQKAKYKSQKSIK